MNKYILIITSILILIIYFSTGCKKEETSSEFVIQADSLKMPDTIQFGTTLDVDFYGLVGTNDCYTFSRIAQLESVLVDPNNSMRVQLYGDYTDNGNCQAGLVYMNPLNYQVTGMFAGTFTVLVQQPDGSVMTGSTYVKE